MKRLAKLICFLILLVQMQFISIQAESYPDAISYIKVTAFNPSNPSERLANVVIGVYNSDEEQVGTYRTNAEGEVLIEVIPDILNLKVIETREGFDVIDEYKVITIDTTTVDLYEVNLPHQAVGSTKGHTLPITGFSPLPLMGGVGLTLSCIGVIIVRRLNHEEN